MANLSSVDAEKIFNLKSAVSALPQISEKSGFVNLVARFFRRIMRRDSIPLVCYWDGRISHGPQGITHENAFRKAVKVNRAITHRELIDKMYNLTGIDREEYKLKILCRYLANRQYISLPIDNDESVDIMLDMTKENGINCVELYIEKSSVLFGSQSQDVRPIVNNSGNEGLKPTTTRDPSFVHFSVRMLDGKEISFKMKPETQLRKLISVLSERGYKEQRIIYGGNQFGEGKTLNECNIIDGSLLHAVGVLRGD